MKLSIIMPVYNERQTVSEIVDRVLNVDLGFIEREIIVVDDGSTDGTRDILHEIEQKHANIKVLLHPRNQGKGAAGGLGCSRVDW